GILPSVVWTYRSFLSNALTAAIHSIKGSLNKLEYQLAALTRSLFLEMLHFCRASSGCCQRTDPSINRGGAGRHPQAHANAMLKQCAAPPCLSDENIAFLPFNCLEIAWVRALGMTGNVRRMLDCALR